jgi:hypothetical protein
MVGQQKSYRPTMAGRQGSMHCFTSLVVEELELNNAVVTSRQPALIMPKEERQAYIKPLLRTSFLFYH